MREKYYSLVWYILTRDGFDLSIITRLVTYAKDLYPRRPARNSSGSFISPNSSKTGQMSKICSRARALLLGQPLTSWRACNSSITWSLITKNPRRGTAKCHMLIQTCWTARYHSKSNFAVSKHFANLASTYAACYAL